MRTTLAALSAILALTALTGQAAAGSRANDPMAGNTSRAGLVLVDDYRPGDGSWRDEARRPWRGDEGRRGWGGDESPRRGDAGDVLSERRVIRKIIRQGFVSVEDIRLRRDRYIVEAVRPNGALLRLAVDAYDGEILARERIGWVRDGARRGPGFGGGWRDRPGVEFDLGGGSIGIYGR